MTYKEYGLQGIKSLRFPIMDASCKFYLFSRGFCMTNRVAVLFAHGKCPAVTKDGDHRTMIQRL